MKRFLRFRFNAVSIVFNCCFFFWGTTSATFLVVAVTQRWNTAVDGPRGGGGGFGFGFFFSVFFPQQPLTSRWLTLTRREVAADAVTELSSNFLCVSFCGRNKKKKKFPNNFGWGRRTGVGGEVGGGVGFLIRSIKGRQRVAVGQSDQRRYERIKSR